MKKTTQIQEVQFVIDDDCQEDLHIRLGLSKTVDQGISGSSTSFYLKFARCRSHKRTKLDY